jgi:hypothetical protein
MHTEQNTDLNSDATPTRRTDLRTTDPHYSWQEVYRRIDCPTSIEPAATDLDKLAPQADSKVVSAA